MLSKNDKIIYNHLKDKYAKSRVWIKKIDETRNYLLDEIKHNNVIRENIKRHVSIKQW